MINIIIGCIAFFSIIIFLGATLIQGLAAIKGAVERHKSGQHAQETLAAMYADEHEQVNARATALMYDHLQKRGKNG